MTSTPHPPESAEPASNRTGETLAGSGMASRRRFLALAGLGAAGAVGVFTLPRLVDRVIAEHSTTGAFGPAGVGRTIGSGISDPGLVLVSIQLAGGVDFLNSVVPLGEHRYRTVRGAGSLDASGNDDGVTLHPLDDTYALNSMPHLAQRWAAGEMAIVHGVGWEGSSLSHFDATDMWEKGSPDFSTRSGWLGRALRDHAGEDADALLGVSMGGVSPSMYADGWSPVGLRPNVRIPWSAEFREEYRSLDRALAELPLAGGTDLFSRARDSQLHLRGIGARLGPIVGERDEEGHEEEDGEERGWLGVQLDLVADLIVGGIPTRGFHVVHEGFDTHANQRQDLPWLLGQLDASIHRFQERLGAEARRVVVATWSEFGRRPEWNGDGTEHGTAGAAFVVGPKVKGGHHGEPSPLDRFDADDNFIVTTDFRDYLGGITLGTLGSDPDRVVDGGRGPLDLVEA